MESLVQKNNLDEKYMIDSAGILDYHEGQRADARMRAHAEKHGYFITHHSRPIESEDFETFDMIIGMDEENIRDLLSIAKTEEQRAKIHRIVEYCSNFGRTSIPDPYYGGAEGFELVITMLENACANLLQFVETL